ncbi:MAG TPA: RidA family protein [Anaerolineaceae bacterium]
MCNCKHPRTVIVSDHAPKAIGPYSIGIDAQGFIFASGQLGIDPGTGALVEGGVEAETRQALMNLSKVLESGGSSLDLVVKTTVFLRDIADFSKMNSIYAEFFTNEPPARSAFQVAALPRGASVEIEAIAMKQCHCEEKEDHCCCCETHQD